MINYSKDVQYWTNPDAWWNQSDQYTVRIYASAEAFAAKLSQRTAEDKRLVAILKHQLIDHLGSIPILEIREDNGRTLYFPVTAQESDVGWTEDGHEIQLRRSAGFQLA